MIDPGTTPETAADLVTQEGRIAFITSVLIAEAETSTASFGAPDFRDEVAKLAVVFADVIGSRRGAYRDLAEQSGISNRLIDVGCGFVAREYSEPPDIGGTPFNANLMINAWVTSVVQKVNGNFQ